MKENKDRYIPDGLYPRPFYTGIVNRTNAERGLTVRFDGVKPTGFAIGDNLYTKILTLLEFNRAVDLETYLDPILKEWKLDGFEGFGTWVDGDHVYIDPITFMDNRDAALKLAKLKGELAIFDPDTLIETRL